VAHGPKLRSPPRSPSKAPSEAHRRLLCTFTSPCRPTSGVRALAEVPAAAGPGPISIGADARADVAGARTDAAPPSPAPQAPGAASASSVQRRARLMTVALEALEVRSQVLGLLVRKTRPLAPQPPLLWGKAACAGCVFGGCRGPSRREDSSYYLDTYFYYY
jgi:hypothetical protein